MAKRTTASVEDRLREIVSLELGVPDAEVTRDSSIVDDLGADSLDVVEIAMRAEEEFGLTIDDDQASEVVTFGDLVALVERLR